MSNPQHEPTMEEILASIRKIISEDAPEGGTPAPAAPAAAAPPAPALAAVPQDDVLELTEEAEAPAAPPEPEPTPEPVLESAAPAAHSDIFSDRTRKAVEDTFNAIPQEPAAPAPPSIPFAPPAPPDGSSVESVFERAVRESFEPVLQKYLADNADAVIERMKPTIREWMDEHFPALLEGAVRTEVERVIRARGSRR
jgi:cell pole-organizing protein PopZ